MKKNALYKEPIYSPQDINRICDEARKFVMTSDTEWSKVQNNIQRMGRTPVQVPIFFKSKCVTFNSTIIFKYLNIMYKYHV